MPQFVINGLTGGLATVETETVQGLLTAVEAISGIPQCEIRLTQAGRDVREKGLAPGVTVWAGLRLLGGKGGGFGTLLRGQGMIVRVDNFEDCRDLSGRRVRDVNNEIRLRDWERRKEEEAQLLSTVTPQPRVPTVNPPSAPPAYRSEVKEASESMKDAVRAAARKRKAAKLDEDRTEKKAEVVNKL